MSRRPSDRLVAMLYPASFGIAYVLLSFAEFPTPSGDLLRPVLLVLAATILLTSLLRLILGTWPRASLASSALLVGLSAPYVIASVLVAGLAWIGILALRGRLRAAALLRSDPARLSRLASVFASAYLLIGVVFATPSVLSSTYLGGLATGSAGSPLPNVYLVILDGYPRGDTLAQVYDFDNQPFETALGELGFSVADRSRSNYPHTWLTLTSMLSGQYLDQVPSLTPAPAAPEDQYRALMSVMNEGQMLRRLEEEGYETVVIPSPFRSVAFQRADRYVDGEQLSAFEYSLLTHSPLGQLLVAAAPDFLMDQQRDRFHAALASILDLAAESRDRPQFVMAHLLSPPHAPLVYGRDGERLPLPPCVPASCALWEFPDDAWDGLSGQIAYTNGEILDALRQLVSDDPGATVILMSDHGSRREAADLDEYFHSFFAARTSGELSFPADISPVNVLRAVVSANSGEDLEPLPYAAWMFADELRPMELRPISPSP